MRLDYVPNPPQFENEEDKAVVERVKERRGERGLQPLDLTLLHSPPVADGWNSFLRAIRTQTSLPTSVREVAICRVAILNKAWYEWDHHAPLLRNDPAAAVSSEGVQYILEAPPHPSPGQGPLDDKHFAVLAYTDAMTLDVKVPDLVFDRLKREFSDREVVEITATVAAYNTVSRFLVALDVGEKNAQEGPSAAH
ncbi:hypothetical protein H2201_004213 [Coniosporium apollinis]|uniref:Carboxymuconolactone decarboxylase-like domain-containing protein n=2 Tax=Coniosporium TaxID=2810619 RepID=A0ABQ9NTJ8_9PEZI|nr:hypothetical protein H2199_007269 [Cladosporium sp. JES 115]KAJ9665729.1 hypothetical protein H2201_004213 [Coniosporium apollinis]